MKRLKIKEAIKRHKEIHGIEVKQIELANLLDGKSRDSRYITMSRLVTGKSKNTPRPDIIIALCKRLDVDPNYLYNWEEEKNKV